MRWGNFLLLFGASPMSWHERCVPCDVLSKKPSIVSAKECRALERHLGEAMYGKKFVLMSDVGIGSEIDRVRDDLLLLLKMSLIIGYAAGVPVTPIACQLLDRMWADTKLGENTNMMNTYNQGLLVTDIRRAFRNGGMPLLHELNRRDNIDFMPPDAQVRYAQHLDGMDQTIKFIQNRTRLTPSIASNLYTGHECLWLPYERSLRRRDFSSEEAWYGSSGHLLWLPPQPNAETIEFLRGIDNPMGIRISATTDKQELRRIVQILNPSKKMGKIVIITCMNPDVLPIKFTRIIDTLRDEPVVWVCDPMISDLRAVHRTIQTFFRVSHQKDIQPHGVHFHMLSNVTERAEAESIETAFLIADLLQQ